MPRIRTIKPEFWSDEKLSLQDPVTRLVFLGLISIADDAGRVVDNVKLLDGQLFPSTADTCRDALEILARISRVCRYRSASGQELLQVTNWEKHQKVDKPSKYVLPAPTVTDLAAKPREPLANVPRDPRDSVARPSRSDLRPTTYDHGPTTEDLRPNSGDLGKERAERRRVAKLVAQLPPGAREFGKHFYGTAPRDRKIDVIQQLLGTLNGGATYRRGVKVLAQSAERLEAKCRQVIADGVQDPDKAIVVLLKKLADVSDDSPTERAAADQRQEERLDEAESARRFALAEAWMATTPEAAAAVERLVDPTLPAVSRRIIHRAAVLKAWTDAGEPIVQPMTADARPGAPV